MKVGVLTSSRADFGIYLPLLRKLKNHPSFELMIIAFGTHLSEAHGYTARQIEESGFTIDYRIDTMPADDSAEAISVSIGETISKFAGFWETERKNFDIVFCLGDRYEMFAAVMAGVPFQVDFAHLHGGETTLGAIDNVFRHSITHAAKYHFVSTEQSAHRVKELIETGENVVNVGALSLLNTGDIQLLTIEDFEKKWGINLANKTILLTLHPETVDTASNKANVAAVVKVITELTRYQVLITMPNADTSGLVIRNSFIEHFSDSKRVFLIENLGTQSYFTALQYTSFLLGNTSSGIIEAASFGKYVINLGNRQKGRISGSNVLNVPFDEKKIMEAVHFIESNPSDTFQNIYFQPGGVEKIIDTLHAINRA